MELEGLTSQVFSDCIGESFRVTAETDAVDVALTEVTKLGRAQDDRPFSIVFTGPPRPVLPQRTYRFEHEALGAFDLFIVPIGPNESGMRYEAVFG